MPGRLLNFLLAIAVLVWLFGCSNDEINGPIYMNVIQNTGGHCEYSIAPAQLTTVRHLGEFRGDLGQVVTSSADITNEDVYSGFLKQFLTPVGLFYTRSGDDIYLLDFPSLEAASLYYAVEYSYKMFRDLSATADLSQIVPNLADTWIVHRAIYHTGDGSTKAQHDNAAYFGPTVSGGTTINFLLAAPLKLVEDMPVGMNLGAIAHEYGHFVFRNLFFERAMEKDTEVYTPAVSELSFSTIMAMNEGFADYFGYLATRDPQFLLCTYPDLRSRDLSIRKYFDEKYTEEMDIHDGGATWVSMQYQIGLTEGDPRRYGALLIDFLPYLATCSDIVSTSGKEKKIEADFGKLTRCHLKFLQGRSATYASAARRIYQEQMRAYGSF